MEQFLAITKKYGVTGVLAIWLWHTDSRLTQVEEKLYDCYENKSGVIEKNNPSILRQYAVLVDKKKTKKSIKEA